MIVREQPDGSILLITQNDHARLSGLMAAHWGNASFERPHPYQSVVRATQYHDLGWLQYETSPRLEKETGRLPNFLEVPNDQKHLAAFDRSHQWLNSIDPYAGQLVTKHRTGVYQARYGTLTKPTPPKVREHSDDLRAYIARSEKEQELASASINAGEFARNYLLLQVWDFLSLWICCNDKLNPVEVHPVPTRYESGAVTTLALEPKSSSAIAVTPYPFDRPSLPLNVIMRRLPVNRFKDEIALYEAYYGASPEVATFTFFDPARALQ